jgi:hypothetical protein
MRPFTDEEFEELPHVLWMSEDDWDPAYLDSVISDDPNWYEAEPSPPLPDPMYDEYGEFRGRVLIKGEKLNYYRCWFNCTTVLPYTSLRPQPREL